jgi:predicted acylesterase/phospholipase RssA
MYTSLVVSGGGLKGFCSLGCLHYLQTKGMLKGLKIFSGTSIGSVVCGLVACRIAPSLIFSKLYNKELIDIDSVSIVDNISNFFDRYGFLDIVTILKHVRDILNESCIHGENITFQDVKNIFDNELYITAVNLSKRCLTTFSYQTHPTMPIIRAMELSCNIPLIFVRQVYEGDEYIDGSIGEHIPLRMAEYGECACIVTRFSSFTLDPTTFNNNGLISYLLRLSTVPVSINIRSTIDEIKNNDRVKLFDILMEGAREIPTSISRAKKLEMFKCGHDVAVSVLSQN